MRHRFKIWILLIVLLLCASVVYGATVRDKMTFTNAVTFEKTSTIDCGNTATCSATTVATVARETYGMDMSNLTARIVDY